MDIILPELSGEDMQATLTCWYVSESEPVSKGQEIAEIVTDKAAFDIPAPCSGKITDIFIKEGEIVLTGTMIARMQENVDE